MSWNQIFHSTRGISQHDCQDCQTVKFSFAFSSTGLIDILQFLFTLQEFIEITGTFKQQKFQLVQSGFNPSTISEPLYVVDYLQKSYVPLTDIVYQNILAGVQKL